MSSATAARDKAIGRILIRLPAAVRIGWCLHKPWNQVQV
jgi:hypothetical protein